MDDYDLIVVGAGISGLSLAWKAASEGRRVLLLERSARVGGCIHSERLPDGYWFELGAHTAYNSYGGFLEVALARGLKDSLRERGPARAKFGFLQGSLYRWLTPPKVLLQLNWLEALLHLPRGLFQKKRGHTLSEHFSTLVGLDNYRRVLAPFLAAVPSQSADEFPAEGPGSLFKARPRRKDILRSFGFEGGLQSVCDAAAGSAQVTVQTHCQVVSVARAGERFSILLADGRKFEARKAAIAAPLESAQELLAADFPAVAAALAQLQTVSLDSVGVVLPAEKAWMPACAFLVPASDSFFSCVTRDPFPDATRRAFTFHFRAGLTREERLRRVCDVLRVQETDLLHLVEKSVRLPAPKRDHAAKVAAIESALAGTRLGLCGNYFEGLAIEDCVQRAFSEWRRISGALAAQ